MSNISADTEEADLTKKFSKVGSVVNCNLLKKASGQNKGFAFVSFESEENKTKALSKNNKMTVSNGYCYSLLEYYII